MKFITIVCSVLISILLIGIILIPIIESTSPEDKPINVLVIAGQSNAEYSGDLEVCNPEVLNEEYSEIPSHKLYYYGTSERPCNEWDWSHKFHRSWAAFHIYDMYDKNKWHIGGYEPILANYLSNQNGCDTLVINTGIGARTIDMLLPDGADGTYAWGVMDKALDQIKNMGYSPNMVGVVWIQGESDHDTPVDQYIQSFDKLENAFAEYGLYKYYLVHTRDYYGGNANIAQEQIATTDPNVMIATYITDTFTLENGMLALSGAIHYSQKGRTAIALDIEDKITVPIPEQHNNINPLLSVIPVFCVIAVVISLVRWIFNNKTNNDDYY